MYTHMHSFIIDFIMLLPNLVLYLNNASARQQYTKFEHYCMISWNGVVHLKKSSRVIPLRKYNLQFINCTSTRKSDVHIYTIDIYWKKNPQGDVTDYLLLIWFINFQCSFCYKFLFLKIFWLIMDEKLVIHLFSMFIC